METFALSYCMLFCCVWLFSLGHLFFSEEEIEGKQIWGREEEKGSEKKGRKKTVVRMYYMR